MVDGEGLLPIQQHLPLPSPPGRLSNVVFPLQTGGAYRAHGRIVHGCEGVSFIKGKRA